MVNNRKRILELIRIFQKETDSEHKLSINELISLLESQNIKVTDRKTLYEDIKALADYGYDVEYDHGYYLSSSPFSLSEIKIITDSINSLKSIDNKLLKKINDKLYSYISNDEEKFLKSLSYLNKHIDKNFIHRLEDVLYAIKNKLAIIIKNKDKEEEIFPLFLYRANDYYYLYYQYPNNEKIYHYRFDNISDIKLTQTKNDTKINISKIIDNINESTNAFHSAKAELIKLQIINDSPSIRARLIDDFPNAIFTKDGLSIRVSINNVLFAKLVAYGKDIKISDPKVANKYKEYLNSIVSNY